VHAPAQALDAVLDRVMAQTHLAADLGVRVAERHEPQQDELVGRELLLRDVAVEEGRARLLAELQAHDGLSARDAAQRRQRLLGRQLQIQEAADARGKEGAQALRRSRVRAAEQDADAHVSSQRAQLAAYLERLNRVARGIDHRDGRSHDGARGPSDGARADIQRRRARVASGHGSEEGSNAGPSRHHDDAKIAPSGGPRMWCVVVGHMKVSFRGPHNFRVLFATGHEWPASERVTSRRVRGQSTYVVRTRRPARYR